MYSCQFIHVVTPGSYFAVIVFHKKGGAVGRRQYHNCYRTNTCLGRNIFIHRFQVSSKVESMFFQCRSTQASYIYDDLFESFSWKVWIIGKKERMMTIVVVADKIYCRGYSLYMHEHAWLYLHGSGAARNFDAWGHQMWMYWIFTIKIENRGGYATAP